MKKQLFFSLMIIFALSNASFSQNFRAGKYRNIQRDLLGMVCENGLCVSKRILDSVSYIVSVRESEDYFTVQAVVLGRVIMVEHFFLNGKKLEDPSSKGNWFPKKKKKDTGLTIEYFLKTIFDYEVNRHPKKVSIFYLKKT